MNMMRLEARKGGGQIWPKLAAAVAPKVAQNLTRKLPGAWPDTSGYGAPRIWGKQQVQGFAG